jgi:hypothetical protein
VSANPLATEIRREVEEEFDYEMSEAQGSWAVNAFLRWNPEEYADKTGIVVTVCD